MKFLLKFLNAMLIFSCLSGCREISPGTVWTDDSGNVINAHGGGILFYEGEYYWFGEHKTEGASGNLAQVGVHCYSSRNLHEWKDRGIVLPVAPERSGSLIEKGCIIERPKVIFNEKYGNFVMWFHLEPKGAGYTGALSGVAVADFVTGPYRFVGAERPDKGYWPVNVEKCHYGPVRTSGMTFDGGSLPAHPDSLNILGRDFRAGQMSRDMTLFVDDDGTAWHVYSSEENSTLHISELSEDYLSHTGRYVRLFPGRFMEAPAMFKRNGKYYLMMSGCTGWAPNEARSAVAESVLGPWRELGNPCVGEGSETTFRSQSTYVLKIHGKDRYIYMGDRWNPENPVDGRYIWLPVEFEDEGFKIRWMDSWKL